MGRDIKRAGEAKSEKNVPRGIECKKGKERHPLEIRR